MKEYRDFINTDLRVKNFYRLNHKFQTVEKVRELKNKQLNKKMTMIDIIKKLDDFVDNSDPDLNVPQSQHCFQVAEKIRLDCPENDWFILTGLIHDCGKILLEELPDYFVVGDTFPVGCRFSDKIVYYEYFTENEDYYNPFYNTEYGIYSPNCGFDNVLFSYSHDEYLYNVCIKNNCLLPKEALYIIRYHSFYAQHQHNAYNHLASVEDLKLMEYVKKFQKYDLYTKENKIINYENVVDYYKNLIDKYFPIKELAL